MKIAITRLENKAAGDRALCASYGHDCYTVSPLRAELRPERVDAFVEAVHRGGEFDCLFFSSALPAAVVGPKLERWPPGDRHRAEDRRSPPGVRDRGGGPPPTFYSRDFVPPYLGEWLRGRTVGIPRADVPNPGLLGGAIAAAGGELSGRSGSTPSSPRVPNSHLTPPTPSSSRAPCPTGEARWQPRDDLLLVAIGEITADAMRAGGHPPGGRRGGRVARGNLEALNRYAEGR